MQANRTLRVLVAGADGFIGRHLVPILLARGHRVTACVRNPRKLRSLFPELPYVTADFVRDQRSEDWLGRIQETDAVINAVGIFGERGEQTYAAIHTRTPQALFAACAQAGVSRVIQVSALGADAEATSGFHKSKKAADDYLAGMGLDWVVVQPSLVYGPDGASARLLRALAALPIVPLPGDGGQQVQPIHVEDLAEALANLVEPQAPVRSRIAAVGPHPLSMQAMLAGLRNALGLPPARFLPIPFGWIRHLARIAERFGVGLLTNESLDMLLRGNTASNTGITRLLGHGPRPTEDFIPQPYRSSERTAARLSWALPLLRLAIAFMWIIAGIVSLGIFPIEASYELLANVGATGAIATILLFGAALLDLALGLATLLLPRRWLWQTQIVLIVAYTIIITVWLPEFWLHPFGPVAKNIPILAALMILLVLS